MKQLRRMRPPSASSWLFRLPKRLVQVPWQRSRIVTSRSEAKCLASDSMARSRHALLQSSRTREVDAPSDLPDRTCNSTAARRSSALLVHRRPSFRSKLVQASAIVQAGLHAPGVNFKKQSIYLRLDPGRENRRAAIRHVAKSQTGCSSSARCLRADATSSIHATHAFPKIARAIVAPGACVSCSVTLLDQPRLVYQYSFSGGFCELQVPIQQVDLR